MSIYPTVYVYNLSVDVKQITEYILYVMSFDLSRTLQRTLGRGSIPRILVTWARNSDSGTPRYYLLIKERYRLYKCIYIYIGKRLKRN